MNTFLAKILLMLITVASVAGCANPATDAPASPCKIEAFIDNKGTIFIAGEKCEPFQIAERIKKLSRKKPPLITLSVDRNARYESFTSFFDACTAAGATIKIIIPDSQPPAQPNQSLERTALSGGRSNP